MPPSCYQKRATHEAKEPSMRQFDCFRTCCDVFRRAEMIG
jgi:hypothetical protein